MEHYTLKVTDNDDLFVDYGAERYWSVNHGFVSGHTLFVHPSRLRCRLADGVASIRSGLDRALTRLERWVEGEA